MRIPFISIALLACCVCALSAQSDKPATSKQIRQKSMPAGNLWRKEAVNLTTQGDTVSPEVRKVRDAYWNPGFPVTTGGGGIVYPSGGSLLVLPHVGSPQEFT